MEIVIVNLIWAVVAIVSVLLVYKKFNFSKQLDWMHSRADNTIARTKAVEISLTEIKASVDRHEAQLKHINNPQKPRTF